MRESGKRKIQFLLIAVPAVFMIAALGAVLFLFSRYRFFSNFKEAVDLRELEWNRFMWTTQLFIVDETATSNIDRWKIHSSEYRLKVEKFFDSGETRKAVHLTPELGTWLNRLSSFHDQIFIKFRRVEESILQFNALVERYPEYKNRRISDLIDVDKTAQENGEIAFGAYRVFDAVNNGLMLSSPPFAQSFDFIANILEEKMSGYSHLFLGALLLLLLFAVMLNIEVIYFRGGQIRAELSARRASEEAALRMKQELEYRVEERTAELQDALDEYTRINTQLTTTNNRLEDAMHTINEAQDLMVEQEKQAALGRLVAGLAHDVNTPLGVSLTAATFFKNRLENMLASGSAESEAARNEVKGLQDSADLLIRNIRKTADIVRYFKQLSLDQQGILNRRQFDLMEYLSSLGKTLAAQIKEQRCLLNYELADSFILDSYPGAFSYAVSNLITNAAQHAYSGKVVNGQIDLEFELRKEKDIYIRCRDHGDGIPPELLKTIFDPFFTTRRSYGSSGLGLSIAYNYVTQVLKGDLTCTSVIGEGTVFTIHVPVEKDENSYRTL